MNTEMEDALEYDRQRAAIYEESTRRTNAENREALGRMFAEVMGQLLAPAPANPDLTISRRQWYAGMAMQGMLMNHQGEPHWKTAAKVLGISEGEFEWDTHYPQYLAMRAYSHADAMLAHEAKEGE